ncbi:MAG: beta-galactosidase [Armatimonadetes bacterium]|nr:beta-galactosidase [Armatimonadota bacterium]
MVLMSAAIGAQNDIPRPEHPRPDFERTDWLNLNGAWQWEIDEAGDGEGRGLTSGADLARTILVPFCPESTLSGIGNTEYMVHTWYRRSFEVPRTMAGKRLLLHFEAVDWHARVWVNGAFAGEHRGGYSPFALEITDLVKDEANEVVVHCYDRTNSGLQATGKQSFGKSEGCVYTRTTGLWQTVWLEAVGETYLREFSLVPDLDNGRVAFTGKLDGLTPGTKVRLVAKADGKVVGEETVDAAWQTTATVAIKNPRPWSPETPFLYDLTIEIVRDGKAVDAVQSYFGLRKISIQGNRFLINDRPIFQRLVLDQGFYPDGIYTAPSDEALKRDIELSMAAGFNGARLHQKVFEPRLLYWADRLGYLVWGEYPSWGLNLGDATAVGFAAQEWKEIVLRDRNHPSLIGWCPLNETGGGDHPAAAQALLSATQTMDPTRPFLDTSGYVHLYPATDVYDCHDYTQDPAAFKARYEMFGLTGVDPWNNNLSDPRSAYRGQPYFVSEYGGIRLKTDRDTGEGWGYGETDLQEFLARYKGLTDVLLDNPNMFGFCYTQLTDIEQEQNGIYFYDREPKYDPALVKAINAREAAYETQGPRTMRLAWRTLVPTSEEAPQEWRYTTEAPPEGWEKPAFDDGAWQTGPGGFGTATTPGAVVGTTWDGDDIWIRRTFRLDEWDAEMAFLQIHHDEDAEVYVNGKQIATFAGYTTDYVPHEATKALKEALKVGDNTLAVHCKQTIGGQFIDVGIRIAEDRD